MFDTDKVSNISSTPLTEAQIRKAKIFAKAATAGDHLINPTTVAIGSAYAAIIFSSQKDKKVREQYAPKDGQQKRR